MVISRKPLQFFICTLMVCMSLINYANSLNDTVVAKTKVHEVGTTHGEKEAEPKDIKTEIKEFIDHHLQDSYDFNIFGYKNEAGEQKHIGFPLPVILYDNGVQVFSSSKFHHGEETAEVNGNFYQLHHNKIYKVESKNASLN